MPAFSAGVAAETAAEGPAPAALVPVPAADEALRAVPGPAPLGTLLAPATASEGAAAAAAGAVPAGAAEAAEVVGGTAAGTCTVVAVTPGGGAIIAGRTAAMVWRSTPVQKRVSGLGLVRWSKTVPVKGILTGIPTQQHKAKLLVVPIT